LHGTFFTSFPSSSNPPSLPSPHHPYSLLSHLLLSFLYCLPSTDHLVYLLRPHSHCRPSRAEPGRASDYLHCRPSRAEPIRTELNRAERVTIHIASRADPN
jgi:hypothetical protein